METAVGIVVGEKKGLPRKRNPKSLSSPPPPAAHKAVISYHSVNTISGITRLEVKWKGYYYHKFL